MEILLRTHAWNTPVTGARWVRSASLRFREWAEYFQCALNPLKLNPSRIPSVHYCGRAPRAGEIAAGGRIKLIYLSQKFPESGFPNLVYLVSSALPSHLSLRIRQAKSQGIPIVLNQNGVAYPGWAGPGFAKVNEPLKLALDSADYVLYQSQFCKLTADRFLGMRSDRFEIRHNAVDTSLFSPAQGRNGHSFKVLLGGNQYQKYRLESAIRAISLTVKQIPQVELLISGKIDWNGDPIGCLNEAQTLVESLKLSSQVKFLGSYTQDEAPSVFHQADLLLHTKYNDPCPTTVLEALSCGIPVVHSMSGGLPELVDSTCGVGIPVKSSFDEDQLPPPESWAAAIETCFKRRVEFAQNARKRAIELFSMQDWLARHQEVFTSVISKGS